MKVINFTVPVPLTERIFGVAEFLSPEQADGKAADQRSNTYGLGALAVFMLTGAPPFSGATHAGGAGAGSARRGDSRRASGAPS